MRSLSRRLLVVGASALIVLVLSQPGATQLAPAGPGADIDAAKKENRRDPRRRLIPLHERPERPMLADTQRRDFAARLG